MFNQVTILFYEKHSYSLVILRQLLISRPGVYGVCQSMYLQTSLPNLTQIMLTLVFFVDFLGDMEC